MGIFSFLTERDWSRNSCYGNSTRGVISFFLWCTVELPSFKNTASIFPEISFIQYLPLFSCKQYDVITDLMCIIENVNISKTKKDISKKKCHSSVFWKAFQISTKNVSFHRHFNTGQDNRNSSLRLSKGSPRPLNRGYHLIEVKITVIIREVNFRTFTTDYLIQGRLTYYLRLQERVWVNINFFPGGIIRKETLLLYLIII